MNPKQTTRLFVLIFTVQLLGPICIKTVHAYVLQKTLRKLGYEDADNGLTISHAQLKNSSDTIKCLTVVSYENSSFAMRYIKKANEHFHAY